MYGWNYSKLKLRVNIQDKVMETITKGGNYGDISLTGNGAHENNDTDILMVINALG